MKKMLVLVAALLGVFTLATSDVHAIVADGLVSPPGEWASFRAKIQDVDEGGIQQPYDVEYFWIEDGNDLNFRFDMFGVPTFVGDSGNVQGPKAFYQVYLDFNNDAVDEYLVEYRQAGVKVYQWDTVGSQWSELGAGTGGMKNIVEIVAPGPLFDDYAPICHEVPVDIRAYVDGGGEDPDDYVPDKVSGRVTWYRTGVHITPEPCSMALMGLGLFGFAGRIVRKRFMA